MNLSTVTRNVLLRHAASIVVVLALTNIVGGQEVDGESKGRLTKIKYLVDQGGKLFKSGDFADSASKIRDAQTAMIALAETGNKAAIDQLKHDYDRIVKAQKLLIAKGESFEAMPQLGSIKPKSKAGSASKGDGGSDSMDAPDAAGDDTELVSFTKQVVPIVLQNCGRCHVEQTLGKYSAATYVSLLKGTRKGKAVKPGDLEMSRMIVLIEEGAMPPQGKAPPVPDDQVAILKAWIEQGAKFDGETKQRNANLTSYVSTSGNGDAGTAGSGTKGVPGNVGDSNNRGRNRPKIGPLGGGEGDDRGRDPNAGRGGSQGSGRR